MKGLPVTSHLAGFKAPGFIQVHVSGPSSGGCAQPSGCTSSNQYTPSRFPVHSRPVLYRMERFYLTSPSTVTFTNSVVLKSVAGTGVAMAVKVDEAAMIANPAFENFMTKRTDMKVSIFQEGIGKRE